MLARFRNSFRCGMPKCPTLRIPGMEKPESSAEGESAVELEDRDPNSLNQHLQVRQVQAEMRFRLFKIAIRKAS